ncbi:MAG: phosphatase [Firmicutes bacterium HGW-Firmicutes-7]|nr:MAG: phosphatase [Firmicutes bacterium HGW-Firmicutes-7]
MQYCLDVHTHTIASGHAYSSLQEMVAMAKQKGLELVGISDHAPGMPGSTYIYYFQNLRVVPKEIDGVKVLKGVEANIIDYQGRIDMSVNELKQLDYVIASMHPPCIKASTKRNNTRALIKTMENQYVNIIGHPDDSRYPMDYEEIVVAAKENNVLLEINNASLNPIGFRGNAVVATRQILALCMRFNHPVILGSDAHISYDVGNFEYCLPVLAEIEFPKELIVNRSTEALLKFLAYKKTL